MQKKVAQVLHRGQENFDIFDDWKKFKKDKTRDNVFYARFVSYYVYEAAEEFSEFLIKNFDAIVVEDAFSTKEEDIKIYNHGLKRCIMLIQYLIL